jgi:uncharacterized protein YqjF (DUF2071 family)
MRMTWTQALLLHWPLPAKAVRRLVPDELEVDTFDGKAWVSILHYRVKGVRPIMGPSIPWFSSFLQIDLRTCVRHNGEPGVYFFSLDASNPVAVWLARTVFRLPYFRAEMQLRRKGESFRLSCMRTHQGARNAEFECLWTPREPLPATERDDLIPFLTERNRLFASHAGRVLTCTVHHEPWPLRRARLAALETTFFEATGLPEPDEPPIAHHADGLGLEIWPLRDISVAEMAAWFDTAASPRA